MSKELRFGLGRVVPDAARAAWGARMIVTQDGGCDLVWDRTDCVGEQADKDRLLDALNEVFPMPMMRRVISSKLVSREFNTREAGEVVILDCTVAEHGYGVKIVGDTNASAGYLSWLTELRPPDAGEALSFDEVEAAGLDGTLRGGGT